MNCRQVRDLLPLYADGELQSSVEASVAGHLLGCPACHERLDLDIRLAAELAAYTPAPATAAGRTALRSKVMAKVEEERRRQPIRRAALRLGNAAAWALVSGVAAALVLAIALTVRPLAERAWRGQAPATTPAPAQSGLGWRVVSEQVIASPYYWVVDGERVDRTPQISPDGTKVAYLPTLDGRATDIDRLVVRDLATGEDLDLTPEVGYSYTSVRWSPDGRSLAFVKHRMEEGKGTASELWRVDASGGNLKRLYMVPGDVPMRGPSFTALRWSADGRDVWIAGTIWGGSSGYLRVHADGSGAEEVRLPTAAGLGAREGALSGGAAFSPADDYILYAARSDGLLSPPQGAPAGGQSLVLYDLKGRQSHVLGSFEGTIYVSDSSISPDGEWISFTTLTRKPDGMPDRLRLWVVRRDGSGLREVTLNGQPAPAQMPGPLWAGGGRAYFNQPPEVSAIWICELDAASGQAGLITHKGPARDLVSVSRDGRRLLAIRGEWERASLYLLELAPMPTPTPAPAVAAPEFGEARDLVELPPSVGASYRLSPDARWLAYTVPDATGQLRLMQADLESGEAGPMLDNAPLQVQPSLPSDAQVIGWLGGQVPPRQVLVLVRPGNRQAGSLLIKDAAAHAPLMLVEPKADLEGLDEAALSPDGHSVAFTVMHATPQAPVPKVGIEVINLDGSGRREVVAPDFFIGKLAWSPDGTELVYFKGKGGTPPEDGDAYVASVAGGEPTLLFPRLRLAAWSPSGAQALWLSEPADEQGRADLYLSAWPPSGAPQLVAKGASMGGAAWAGSDGWFVYSKGDALYLAQNGGREQLIRLTPEGERADAPVWAPGKGLIYRAERGGRAVLRLLPLKGAEPAVRGTAGLTVEEHPVVDQASGFPTDAEGTGWIPRTILDLRRVWRELPPSHKVAEANDALRPFGYRLEPKEKPGWSQTVYDLLRGSEVVVPDVVAFRPVSVSAAGDDLAMVVEPLNGPYQLVRPTGTEEWDAMRHQYQPPVFVGRDLVTVTGVAELRNVTVLQGQKPVYTSFVDWEPASLPIKGLWSWEGHWVLEVSGHVVVDGKDLNRELGYDEIFGYRLLYGRPFYFFRQGGRVGISYDGVVLPHQYEEVPHYGCCSAAAYNPGGNDRMVWFFGLRDGTWYYVEMGHYGAEEEPALPAPTPEPLQGAGALKALHMVDAQTGWALAERAILRTADGGRTWADVTPAGIPRPAADGSTYWAGQHFVDRDHAWVLVARGQELTLLRTADAGRTWQEARLPVEGMGALFTSLDAERGWALVGQGVAAGSEAVAVLGTEDGGATWALLSATDPQNPQPGQLPFGGNKRGIAFADAANGWVSVYQPVDGRVLLYATHDGGRTWAEQVLPLPAGYADAQAAPEAPVFFNAREGALAVGLFRHAPVTVLYVTRDGGATWTPTTPIIAADGGAIRMALLSADEGRALVAPVPGISDRVELRHTTDGGRTWTTLGSDPALAKVLELQFADRDRGWALCNDGQSSYVLVTQDGGRTWARLP